MTSLSVYGILVGAYGNNLSSLFFGISCFPISKQVDDWGDKPMSEPINEQCDCNPPTMLGQIESLADSVDKRDPIDDIARLQKMFARLERRISRLEYHVHDKKGGYPCIPLNQYRD